MQTSDAPSLEAPRVNALDLAKGLLIVAMIIYHGTWDLAFTGLIDFNITQDPQGRWLGHAIAHGFVFMAGISAWLTHEKAQALSRRLKRIAIIALAAAGITLASVLVVPDAIIWFGILHLIALCTLLGLALNRLPTFLLLIMIGLVVGLTIGLGQDFVAQPLRIWSGLSIIKPQTNDFAPIFPGLATFMAGIVAARLWPFQASQHADQPSGTAQSLPHRLLTWLGQHTLTIYLLHQPVLIGVLLSLRTLV